MQYKSQKTGLDHKAWRQKNITCKSRSCHDFYNKLHEQEGRAGKNYEMEFINSFELHIHKKWATRSWGQSKFYFEEMLNENNLRAKHTISTMPQVNHSSSINNQPNF